MTFSTDEESVNHIEWEIVNSSGVLVGRVATREVATATVDTMLKNEAHSKPG